MNRETFAMAKLGIIVAATLAMVPFRAQTVEEACKARAGRTEDATVRVSWTDVETSYDDVRITYCVLRGNPDAKLAFERDAEIVYFALSSEERRVDRRSYTFEIRTSTGRVFRQGPALLQPLSKEPQSCRVDICQFFTDPGERVVSVAVVAREAHRRS